MTKRTILKIIGYYVLLVGGMFLILAGVNWYMLKQEAVRIGMARPNFPYTKYSQDELNKMYPQYPNENVATTQTPEETYAKFIATLKAGDIDGAINLTTNQNHDSYQNIFAQSKKENKLEQIIQKFDFSIKQKEMNGNTAFYVLENGKPEEVTVVFIKNLDGVWYIDSL